jgi:hypothetical protein
VLDTGKASFDDFDVDSARIWDCPDGGVPIAVAAGGTKVVEELGPLADHFIATEPEREIVEAWNALDGRPTIGEGARAIGQIPISWDPSSVDAAVKRAHEQFRWFGGGWSVNAERRSSRSGKPASLTSPWSKSATSCRSGSSPSRGTAPAAAARRGAAPRSSPPTMRRWAGRRRVVREEGWRERLTRPTR